MSIQMKTVRGIAAGAAVTGALLFGAPAAQAAPAPVPQTISVQLADFVSPIVAPEGMPMAAGHGVEAPMWWGHHHHHRLWHPWRWFWFW